MTTEVSIFCWRMLVALLGACIGSFLNVIIYRVPLMIQKHDEQFINEHLFLRTGKKERGDDRPLNIIFPAQAVLHAVKTLPSMTIFR